MPWRRLSLLRWERDNLWRGCAYEEVVFSPVSAFSKPLPIRMNLTCFPRTKMKLLAYLRKSQFFGRGTYYAFAYKMEGLRYKRTLYPENWQAIEQHLRTVPFILLLFLYYVSLLLYL